MARHMPARAWWRPATSAFLAARASWSGPVRVLPGGPGLQPGQPEFLHHVRRRPAGFPFVHGALQPQLGVAPPAQVDALDPAEDREAGVPVGPGLWGVLAGFGSDRVGFAVVSIQLPIGGQVGGSFPPDRPRGRVARHITKRFDGPGGPGLHCVLTEPSYTVVHRRGQFG